MPDWISHLLIAYIAINLFGIKNKKPVYIGTLLPDAFKLFIPFSKILGITSEPFLNFFAPFHTVFGVLLSGLFISSFFSEWRRTYSLILLGVFLHLSADMLLYPWGIDVWVVYPLWKGFMDTGIFWPDGVVPLAILLSISSVFYLRNRLR